LECVERLLDDVPITSTKLRRLRRQHPALSTHLYMLSGLVLSPTGSVDVGSSSSDRFAHSLASWDSCPTPAKSEAIEYLQVGPTEVRYSIARTIFVYLYRGLRKQKYSQI